MAMATGRVMKRLESGAGRQTGLMPARSALALLLAATATAHAQTMPAPTQATPARVTPLKVAPTTGGAATGMRIATTRIAPSLDTRLMWSDNIGASASDKRDDWVLEVSPGISMLRESGRLRGRFTAQARNFAYASESERNTNYVTLSGSGEFEAIEQRLFIEADARVSRGDTSALQGRPAGDVLSNDKNNETRIWSIGPRLNFRVGNADGVLRYQSRWYSGGRNTYGDQRIERWKARLGDPSAFRLFGWQADYERTDTTYDERRYRSLSEEIGRATFFVNLTPQFRVYAIAGHESSDYLRAEGEDGEFFGGGFDWQPNARTRLSAVAEDRFIGRMYNVQFNHRMSRLVWNASFRNEISSSTDALAARYDDDPLFQAILNNPGLVSAYEDPLERENVARRLYDEAYGVDSLLTNAYYLERSAGARVSFLGVRNVLSLSLQRRNRSPVSQTGASGVDDLADYRRVDTRSATVSLNHRLSGRSALVAAYTHSKSEAYGGVNRETERRSTTVGISTRLGPNTSGSVSFRHQTSDGVSTYTENAVIGHLGMRF